MGVLEGNTSGETFGKLEVNIELEPAVRVRRQEAERAHQLASARRERDGHQCSEALIRQKTPEKVQLPRPQPQGARRRSEVSEPTLATRTAPPPALRAQRQAETMHPWLDSRLEPIYVLTLPPEASDRDLVELLAALEQLIRQMTKPCAWLTDTTKLMSSSAQQRRMVAEFLCRVHHTRLRVRTASALLVNSRRVHGIITAIRWLTPFQVQPRLFHSRLEALAWLDHFHHASAAAVSEAKTHVAGLPPEHHPVAAARSVAWGIL